ncbi:serine hydrolase domain-containing protein [Lysobacter xanthus]
MRTPRVTPRFVVVLLLAGALLGWFAAWRPVNAVLGPLPVDTGDGWPRSTPANEGFDEAALQRAAAALLGDRLNVHAVLVERHGRLVLESYRGGHDRSVYGLVSLRRSIGPTSRHDVRSVGKSITALVYGIALSEGRVPGPSRPLSVVFPALQGLATRNAREIRVGHLLDMDSGLAWTEGAAGLNDELKLFWKRDLPTYVLDRPRTSAPGTRFSYNGGGTALLAQMIADGTRTPLDRYTADRLFAPLGIRDWEWVTDLHGRPMAFNGLRLRPRDLLKIGRLVLRHGDWDGRRVVPSAWIDALWQPGLATGVADFRYHGQWWQGTVDWHGRRLEWRAAFGNGGQRLFVVPALDIAIVTAAGAYDEMPTAVAVNRFVQQVADSVRD